MVWPCGRHGLGLISLRAARERLPPRELILRAVPRKHKGFIPWGLAFIRVYISVVLGRLPSRAARYRPIMHPGLAYINTHGYTDLVIRRYNMRAAWTNYRRTSRTRTFGNVPLAMQ